MTGGAVTDPSIRAITERNRNRIRQSDPAAPSVLDTDTLPQGGENIPSRGAFLGPARDIARFSPRDIGLGGGDRGNSGRPIQTPGSRPTGGGRSTTPLVPGAGSGGSNPRPGPVFGPAPTHRPPPVGPDPERPNIPSTPTPPFRGHPQTPEEEDEVPRGPNPGGGGGGGGTSPGPGGGGTGGAPDRRSLANLGITQLAPGFRARRQRRSRTAQTLGG